MKWGSVSSFCPVTVEGFRFSFGLDALFDEEVGEERSEDENPGEEVEELWSAVLGVGDEYQDEGSNNADQVVGSKEDSDESEVQGEGNHGEFFRYWVARQVLGID